MLLELEGRQLCTVAQGLLYLMTWGQAVLWNCLSALKHSCCQGTMGATMEGTMGVTRGVNQGYYLSASVLGGLRTGSCSHSLT